MMKKKILRGIGAGPDAAKDFFFKNKIRGTALENLVFLVFLPGKADFCVVELSLIVAEWSRPNSLIFLVQTLKFSLLVAEHDAKTLKSQCRTVNLVFSQTIIAPHSPFSLLIILAQSI